MTKNNSVHQMVEVLKRIGPMTENEIQQTAFGYDRNNSFGSNKKYICNRQIFLKLFLKKFTKGKALKSTFPNYI